MAGPVSSKRVHTGLCILSSAAAAYGLYAFWNNQIPAYLFLTSPFVFFDFERPVFLFFAEYLAIMGLFVFLAHYGTKGVRRLQRLTMRKIVEGR